VRVLTRYGNRNFTMPGEWNRTLARNGPKGR